LPKRKKKKKPPEKRLPPKERLPCFASPAKGNKPPLCERKYDVSTLYWREGVCKKGRERESLFE